MSVIGRRRVFTRERNVISFLNTLLHGRRRLIIVIFSVENIRCEISK